MKQMFENFPCLEPLKNFVWFKELGNKIAQERKAKSILPERENVFRAFHFFSQRDLKLVILGLEPYPDKESATGLAFGIPENSPKIPYSLNEIKREVEREFDTVYPSFDYTLESWARQGVLLLNTSLTIQEVVKGSHNYLWSRFTEFVLGSFGVIDSDIAYLLLGSNAQSYAKHIDGSLFKASHPAASAYNPDRDSFTNCGKFLQINKYLLEVNKTEIKWG